MPVHRKRDRDGPYYQWGGHGAKYHYVSGDARSRDRAKAQASAQGRAAHAHARSATLIPHTGARTNRGKHAHGGARPKLPVTDLSAPPPPPREPRLGEVSHSRDTAPARGASVKCNYRNLGAPVDPAVAWPGQNCPGAWGGNGAQNCPGAWGGNGAHLGNPGISAYIVPTDYHCRN